MKRIIISLGEELLKKIDEVNVYVSRAEFIRECVRSRLIPLTPHVIDCVCNECMAFLPDKRGLTKEDLLALKNFQLERVTRRIKNKQKINEK